VAKTNVELLHEVLDLYEREGFEALVPFAHPDVEIRNQTNVLEAGDYHGIDAGVQMNARWEEAWADSSYELKQVEELDDETLIAEVVMTVRGDGSGAEVKATQWWLFSVRQGRFSRWHLYLDRDAALKAAAR
jgi:ketosteroid isomerase-like protein